MTNPSVMSEICVKLVSECRFVYVLYFISHSLALLVSNFE